MVLIFSVPRGKTEEAAGAAPVREVLSPRMLQVDEVLRPARATLGLNHQGHGPDVGAVDPLATVAAARAIHGARGAPPPAEGERPSEGLRSRDGLPSFEEVLLQVVPQVRVPPDQVVPKLVAVQGALTWRPQVQKHLAKQAVQGGGALGLPLERGQVDRGQALQESGEEASVAQIGNPRKGVLPPHRAAARGKWGGRPSCGGGCCCCLCC